MIKEDDKMVDNYESRIDWNVDNYINNKVRFYADNNKYEVDNEIIVNEDRLNVEARSKQYKCKWWMKIQMLTMIIW